MSFVVSCQCGKQYRVPDEQRGKRTRCKNCGQVLQLVPDEGAAIEQAPPPPPPPPASVPEDYDPFAGIDWSTAAGPQAAPTYTPSPAATVPVAGARGGGPPPPPQPAQHGGPRQRPCPSCGQTISAFALRCEFCGAALSQGMAMAQQKKGAQRLSYAAAGAADDSSLSVLDWILCIVCPGIGCIVGIVYAAQGKPKGGKMIGIAFLVGAISSGIRFAIRQSMGGGE